jgi:pantoate--beta-alanine ligase
VQVVSALADIRARTRDARGAGRRIGFVPTMGYLHAGHLSLVAEARARSDLVVMSVFVNPLQFGPAEDFASYPRDLQRDQALAAAAGVDVFWAPTTEAMYPERPQVVVSPGPAGELLEGAARPGHFAGVLTVVLKLFAVVQPDVAVFGRKDFQQAALIGRMVRDLGLPVEIVVASTVRESDGLALSSRNVYLDAVGRSKATALVRALAAGVAQYRSGDRRAAWIVAAAQRVLEAERDVAIDYVACVGPQDMQQVQTADERSILAVAARIGGTRLIDNVVLGQGLEGDARVGR